MKQEVFDIIVIGGGPAGMMAAGRAGELNASVLLIEKNDRLGKKLSITGGRRCNITNAEENDRIFLENFPESKQFLFSPFSQFNVKNTFEFFEGRNLPLVIEDRKRAFPKSQNAEDVCSTLENFVKESGNVTVQLNTTFQSFILEKDVVKGTKTSKGTFFASKIILASGGLAAPETGSTGEGLSALAEIKHTIKEPDPNLAPLRTPSKWVHALSGTTLDDVSIRFIQKNKTKLKKRGRILFTHFGISGPLIINSAFEVKKLLKNDKLIASIDLFPDTEHNILDKQLTDLFEQSKKRTIKNVFKDMLQKKVTQTVLKLQDNSIEDKPSNTVSKTERKALTQTLKNLEFPITGTMGFKWSIVADGGVIPKEVDFKHMNSRIYPNLYLIGDTLDINRPSGGFSLQLCWTTGWVAGTHAVQSL